jgi:protease-4
MKKEARRVQVNTMDAGIDKKHSHAGYVVTIIFLAIAFMLCFFLLIVQIEPPSDANTAVIHVDGVILTGSGPGYFDGNTYSNDIISFIEDASKNNNIKAIIFEINSPGGSAVASSEINQAIKKARASGKTTVALIREQGTSGAYWIASACDYIITHQLSITGSIGVLASYLEYSGLLERFNITYEQLNAGIYKDTMSPYRELSPEEKLLLQQKVNLIYNAFVKEVALNRNLSEEKVRDLATGMFYIGEEAKNLGLVDELGGKDETLNYVHKRIGKEPKIKEYVLSSNFLLKLYGLQDKAFFMMGKGIGTTLVDSQNFLNIRA